MRQDHEHSFCASGDDLAHVRRPEADRYWKHFDEVPREHPYRILVSRLREGERVLDVGCGNGQVGAYLQSQVAVSVHGIEPNAERADEARKRLEHVVRGEAGSSSISGLEDPYDVVLFLDVLEHVPQPSDLLRWGMQRMRPTGRIFAMIPNSAHWSFRRKILRGDWSYQEEGLFDSTHLRFFDIHTVDRLASLCGLTEKGRWYNPLPPDRLPGPPTWWTEKWPNLFALHVLLEWERSD